MKKILSLAIMLLAFCISLSAQTASTAKQINSIKKDKNYIHAEATDESEQTAYSAAKSILDTKIDDYINEQGLIEGANAIIIKDIRKDVKKLALQRGTRHYVFIYVKRTDIIKSESEVEVITINKSAENDSESNTAEPIPSAVETKVEPKPELPQNVSITEKDRLQILHEINLKAHDYLSKMPKYRQNIIKDILETMDLTQAQKIIKNEMLIQKYGVKKDCPEPDKMYWVVKDEKGITVLSPVKNGSRVNIKTNATDKLDNYKDGIWIRFK